MNNELDRIRRMVAVLGLFLLLFIVGGIIVFVVWFTTRFDEVNKKLENLQNQQIELQNKIPQVKNGEVGPQGEQGLTGAQGFNGLPGLLGSNGLNGFSIQGPQGEQGDTGEKGDTGPQGEPGPPGRTVFFRTNPDTGEAECRYSDSTIWVPAEECQ